MIKPVSNIWLRGDISMLTFDTLDEGESRSVYVAHVTRPESYDPVDRFCEESLEPVFSIPVDGAPILNVFRLDAEQWRDVRELIVDPQST